MSMIIYPDYVIENLLAAIVERQRLKELSNEDLVREYLKLTEDQDDELHTNEMCSRLWPEWYEEEL